MVERIRVHGNIHAAALVAGRRGEKRWLAVVAIGGGVREWECHANQKEDNEGEGEDGRPEAWWYGRRMPLGHLLAGPAVATSL